jgi:hypothetical protein
MDDGINLTHEQGQWLISALLRMEHKCQGSMYKSEYEAATSLAQSLQCPQFITEYFARKAATATE